MRVHLLLLVAACGGGSSSSDRPADAGVDAAPPLFAPEAYFKASTGAAGDGFGPLALNAGRMVVGAPGRANAAGAAYAFSRRTTGWLEEIVLTGSNTAGDEFGSAIGLDADTLWVGAPGAQNDTGAVYLFERLVPSWGQVVQPFTGGGPGARFGAAISIVGDWAVIGAPGEGGNSGAAYLFHRTSESGVFAFEQKLTPFSTLDAGDEFGRSVTIALVTDPPVIAVGAPGDDDGGDGQGAVYLFERKAMWGDSFKVKPDAAGARSFGAAVSAYRGMLAVGAPAETGGGAVYVFEPEALANAWSQQARLVASDRADTDRFGAAVATYGFRVVAGAPGKNGGAGLVYMFDGLSASWAELARVSASNGEPNDAFGEHVASQGTEFAVGAPFESSSAKGVNADGSNNDASKSGAAYTFVQTRPQL